MRRTNIYLEDRQAEELDVLARRQQVTRAEVVRRFIDGGLAAAACDLEDDLAAIDASFGALADDADALPARGPTARDSHLDSLRAS